MFDITRHRPQRFGSAGAVLILLSIAVGAIAADKPAMDKPSDQAALPDQTYMKVQIEEEFPAILARDQKAMPRLMARQKKLLESRYDLPTSRRREDVGRPQGGAGRRAGETARRRHLAEAGGRCPPSEIKREEPVPEGLSAAAPPQPSRRRAGVSQVQIDEMKRQEGRDLTRFDLDFDLPDHFTARISAADLT